MSEKKTLILCAAAAMVVLPIVAVALNYSEYPYIKDSGHDSVTAAELLSGKRPNSLHVTITDGFADQNSGVEYIITEDGSEKEHWYYTAVRASTQPEGVAPVLVATETPFLSSRQHSWSGDWTNGDEGIGDQVVALFQKQGITFSDNAIVVNLDKSRQSRMIKVGLFAAIGFAVPLIFLLCLVFLFKDPEKAKKALRDAKSSLSQDTKNARLALRQAIAPYLVGAEGTVQVRGNCIMKRTPEVVFVVGDKEQPAPADLESIVKDYHQRLKKQRVPCNFITYTTFRTDEAEWKDKMDFS